MNAPRIGDLACVALVILYKAVVEDDRDEIAVRDILRASNIEASESLFIRAIARESRGERISAATGLGALDLETFCSITDMGIQAIEEALESASPHQEQILIRKLMREGSSALELLSWGPNERERNPNIDVAPPSSQLTLTSYPPSVIISGPQDAIEIPASDRIVTLNHNSDLYRDAVEALDRVITEFKEDRILDNKAKAEKIALVRTLEAGRELLLSQAINLHIGLVLLVDPLKRWLETYRSEIRQATIAGLIQSAISKISELLLGPN